jgi:hypothetical protein
MLRTLTCIALMLAVAAVCATASEAGSRKGVRSAPPPVKDCTRLNGRWGYYGNPWCTPAEQLAFDRAEARRLGR